MATEVKHGPRPRFRARLQPSTYNARIVGHYTHTDGLTAAGVAEWNYASDRPPKRQAELLGMRSAFVGWFLEEWVRHGGSWQQGVAAFRRYPFDKLRQGFLEHRDPLVRAAGRVSWSAVWQAARWSLRTAWALLRRRAG